MDRLVREMVAYCHASRTDQAKAKDLPVLAGSAEKADEPAFVRLSDICCKKRLDGLFKHYDHKAA